jgi:HD-GYP domain-containing protein (c-di-GMP phosphodiesterase class II)
VGRLSDQEFDLIKLHPVIGANILRDLNYMGSYTEYVRYHHEKFDGTGYPEGLKGEDIPLGARIITIADSFDAMTSDRSYRKKMTIEEALDEVRSCAGSHFDPSLARFFIECWQEKAPAPQMTSVYAEIAPLTEK